ncbi:MAG: putative DNA-binding domain-containing protein [Proteobacteria bacterium]|nr:putative DNA-binding domain-containing protein [Pseudomonadota bacterium]
MSLRAPTFSMQQAALQDWLMHGNPAVSNFIAGNHRDERLRIYGDAYQLRLIDVLANDFPVLRALTGEAMFETLATGYLHAHPSRHPSVRRFGRDLADWLRRQEHPSIWSALARFEWMQGEVFDAIDAIAITMEDVATLPADAWPGLRLELHPTIRRLRAPDCIPAMIEAHHAGNPPPPANGSDPSDWLLWRDDFIVRWRRIDADEAALLDMAANGATFVELCARLATFLPESETALRAIGLLKRWITDGLVIAATPSPDTIPRNPPCNAAPLS